MLSWVFEGTTTTTSTPQEEDENDDDNDDIIFIRDANACRQDYEMLRTTSQYPTTSIINNNRTKPNHAVILPTQCILEHCDNQTSKARDR